MFFELKAFMALAFHCKMYEHLRESKCCGTVCFDCECLYICACHFIGAVICKSICNCVGDYGAAILHVQMLQFAIVLIVPPKGVTCTMAHRNVHIHCYPILPHITSTLISSYL